MKKKVSQIKGGIVLSYLSLIVSNGIGLVYTPIMIRLLGQSEYGLYNLVASFVSYLGLLSFGFDNTYLRYYVQYKHKESREKVASLNGMFLIVFTVIGILAGVCGMVLRNYADVLFGAKLTAAEIETAKNLMVLLVINIALAFPAKLFSTYVNANEKFIFSKVLNMVKSILNPLIVLPLLLMGYKSYALVLSTLIYSVIIDLANVYYCFAKLDMQIRFKNFEFKVFKGIAAFSFFVFLGEIVDEINWQLDKFLLGRYCGTIAVAVYGVASSLSAYFRQFSVAVSGMFGPRVNKIVAKSDNNTEITDLLIKVGRVQFLILSLVAVGFVFCGKEFCVLWAGEAYAGSYIIAVALILPSMIPLIQNVGISVLTARNKHKFRSVAYFFIALANLAISIPLCQRFEGLGCALGTGISMLIGNGLIINLYYKKMGLEISRFWKSILSLSKGLLPMIFVGIVSMQIPFRYTFLDLLIRIAVLAAAYAVGMLAFGMNADEKEMCKSVLKKVKLLR